MKRSGPLKRSSPLVSGKPLARTGTAPKRQKPLKPVSGKRKAANQRRSGIIAALFPERPPCEVTRRRHAAGLPPLPVCNRWADDVHETKSRSRGSAVDDASVMSAPCRPCHDVLTFTPESELVWAYSIGLLAHSWEPEKRHACHYVQHLGRLVCSAGTRDEHVVSSVRLGEKR